MTECNYRQSCDFVKNCVTGQGNRERYKALFEAYCNGPGMNQCAIRGYLAERGQPPHNLLPNGQTAKDVNEVLILAFVGLAVLALAWLGIWLL